MIKKKNKKVLLYIYKSIMKEWCQKKKKKKKKNKKKKKIKKTKYIYINIYI